jgi:hypothetical protein
MLGVSTGSGATKGMYFFASCVLLLPVNQHLQKLGPWRFDAKATGLLLGSVLPRPRCGSLH